MKRSRLMFALIAALGCSESVDQRPADVLALKRSALSGTPGHGPLVVGTQTDGSGVFLFDPANPNQFPRVGISAFSPGDAVAAGDVDGDGVAEVLHGFAGGTVGISKQDGTSLLPADLGFGQLLTFPFNSGLAVGDINGDGFGDVVIAERDTGSGFGEVFVVTSHGAAPIPISDTAGLPFPPGAQMVVCDLDHDGFDDILVAPSFLFYSGLTRKIQSFVSTLPPFNPGSDKLACGDLNGDGFNDVITAHPEGGGEGFFQVLTNPAQQPFTFFGNTTPPAFDVEDEIAVGDLDGDGVAEVVIGHIPLPAAGAGSVRVFSAPGKTAPASPAFLSFAVGDKLAIPPSEASPSTFTTTVPYFVEAILYQPPFDKSATSYSATSTIGTKTSWKLTDSNGLVVVEKAGKIGGGLTFTTSQIVGGAVVTQTTDSAGDGIHRGDTFCADPNTPCDPTLDPDHTADQFVILLGADGQVNQFGSGPPTLKVDLSTGSLRRFTVAELQRLAQDPQDLTVFCNSQGCDEDKKTLAPTFIKTADAQQLLAMDPYFAHEQLDQHPERFEPACKTAGTCASPERLTVDSKPASPATAADPTVSETHLQGNGSESSNGSSTGLKEDLTIFGIGGTTSITYEDVTTVSNFTSQSASVTFENSSHCEKGTVDLWLDKSFGSFLWVTHLENACQQQPMQTMSFEALADWQIQGGGAATLSAQRVTGDHAFSISAQGWTPVVSIPLGSALLRGAATSTNLAAVSFALSIPTNQPNPFWIGAAQMYISAPSANIYNAYMGQVELTPLPEGQFVRLGFTIPDYALHALTENHPDVSFTIVLNVNAGTSGWLVDDLSIGN